MWPRALLVASDQGQTPLEMASEYELESTELLQKCTTALETDGHLDSVLAFLEANGGGGSEDDDDLREL